MHREFNNFSLYQYYFHIKLKNSTIYYINIIRHIKFDGSITNWNNKLYDYNSKQDINREIERNSTVSEIKLVFVERNINLIRYKI